MVILSSFIRPLNSLDDKAMVGEDDIKPLYDMANNLMSKRTLWIGLCCGCVSVLVDADHFIAYQIFGWASGGRFLHIPLFILVCLMLVGMGAYIRRLHSRMVLKKEIIS
jgi:hypothetical protein